MGVGRAHRARRVARASRVSHARSSGHGRRALHVRVKRALETQESERGERETHRTRRTLRWASIDRTRDRQARCARLSLHTPRAPSVMVQRLVPPNRPASEPVPPRTPFARTRRSVTRADLALGGAGHIIAHTSRVIPSAAPSRVRERRTIDQTLTTLLGKANSIAGVVFCFLVSVFSLAAPLSSTEYQIGRIFIYRRGGALMPAVLPALLFV